MSRRNLIGATLAALCVVSAPVLAGVTAEEAAELGRSLTPFGAERAANKDGSIPEWKGGVTAPPAGYVAGTPYPDLFSGEKPILQINAANLAQHKELLSEGTQVMLNKYPNYRIDVYPSHRTAAAPQWVYDNTLANATRATTTNGGNSVEGAYGGVPFPIPKTGAEVMWNHLLRWRGEAFVEKIGVWVVDSNGKPSVAVKVEETQQWPYYEKNGSLESFNGDYWYLRQVQFDPPFKAGESVIIHDPLDQVGKGRKAWQYLAGQRRVRRAPTIAFDTPDFVASGQNYFDEVYNFLGSLERYEWKLVGKKEMFVPYNNNRLFRTKAEDAMAGQHLDPDQLRWERHRVWVVEANLAPGKRHAVPKKTFYIDEDTWSVLMMDGYDASGNLWRTQHALPIVAPDIPAVLAMGFALYNLQANTWIVSALPADATANNQFVVIEPRPYTYFSPDALAGGGIR